MTATPDTTIARLTRQIALLRENISLRELDRADATIALLTNPDDEELKAQLAKAVKDIEAWRAALEGAEGALVVAQNRDVEAGREEAEAARQHAAKEARALMAESLKIAKQVDKAAEAFAVTLGQMNEVNRRISRLSYDAGLRGENRHNLLAVRYAGGVLANQLIACGLYEHLDHVNVSRPPFPQGTAYTDLVKGNIERLETWLARTLAQEG